MPFEPLANNPYDSHLTEDQLRRKKRRARRHLFLIVLALGLLSYFEVSYLRQQSATISDNVPILLLFNIIIILLVLLVTLIARNLIKLAKRYPNAHCFGIDAAHVMIETARKNIAKAGLSDRVTVRQGLAQNLSPAMFDRDEPFDVTYFSYSLSMIPPWKESVDAAVAATKPGRTVYSVDFWDQSGYPAWFRAILQKWLDLFHVHFHPELLEYLKTVAQQQGSELQLKPIGKQYAYIAAVKTKR